MSSRRWRALFANKIYGEDGALKRELSFRPNLRTNDGIDWQSGVMGGVGSYGSYDAFTATSSSATSVAATGVTFPTSGGFGNWSAKPLVGRVVVALASGGLFGVIIDQPDTHTLTVDRWNDPTNPGGAAGTTPSGTGNYAILPGGAPTWWMALTADATAPAATDHTLASELTTNGFARAKGGVTHTNGTNTFTLNNLFTCTGGSTTINKEAVFNAQNGGIMTFESAEPSPPTLITNDTLSQSVVVTY